MPQFSRYEVTKRAGKDLNKLSAQVRTRIGKKLKFYLESDSPINFAERLSEPADARYRFRIGEYRVLFDVDKDVMVILRVQHRSEVYKKRS